MPEPDDAGRAQLRFGDGDLGRRAAAGTAFTAVYRIGNGPEGNVGAEAIDRIGLRDHDPDGGHAAPAQPPPGQRRDRPRAARARPS